MMKMVRTKKNKIKVGDKIRIKSFPRLHDGADAYAGIVGIVEEIDYDEVFTIGKGSITLRLDSEATFIGVGINRMTYEILT
jgi:hypothetical protein